MRAILGLSLVALLAACGGGGSGGASGGPSGGPAPTPSPAPAPSPAPTPEPAHPNVIVFLVDDLGWRDVGFMGSPFYDTPNVDKLAGQGMRFDQAYSAAPVCSPSRAALLTGMNPVTTGVTDITNPAATPANSLLIPPTSSNKLELSADTLAERFKRGGYATMFAGKWHLGPTSDYWPEKQGFDVNAGGTSAGNVSGSVAGREYFSPYRNPRLSDGPTGEYIEDRLAAETTKFIRAHKAQRFFVLHAFYSVHTPFNQIDPYFATYQAKVAGMPGGTEPSRNVGYNVLAKMLQNLAPYGSMVSAVDGEVGKILAELDQDGLTSNTVVVFTSDNGGLANYAWGATSNEPLRAGKAWLYEGGIRVPLVIKAPGVTQAGSHTSYPTTTVDLVPTLLHLANLPSTDPSFEGIDLFQTDPLPATRDLFWHFPHYEPQGWRPGGAVRSGDWKLVELFEGDRAELYNLADDPGETHDLAALRPDVVADLRAKLAAWRSKVGAKMPVPR